MENWIDPTIPCFAVIGRVNMGKSSVLATLLEIDDNELIRISGTPGETTNVHRLPLILDGKECIRFLDTPGFTQPVEAMKAIQNIAGERTPHLADLITFVARCATEFPDECRLLQPLIEGAGMLYIVDPSNPLRDSFIAEMEILRWSGRPRLALLNQKESNAAEEQVWRNRLGTSFNLVRTFNAHHARFEQRLRLLRSLLEIEESFRPALEKTISLIEQEWEIRREESAEVIVDFLESALLLRASKSVDINELHSPARKKKLLADLQKNYYAELAKLEQKASKQLLKLYRHHLLKADYRADAYVGLDLESQETWKKWGLSRGQLTVAATITGAIAGSGIDLGTGGLTHGAATIFGAVAGAIGAYFGGAGLPNFKATLSGLALDNAEQRSIQIGPPSSLNFPWILLDSLLLIRQHILERSHGRRDEAQLKIEAQPTSFSRELTEPQRKTLQKWFISCIKGSPDRGLEPEVYQIVHEILDSHPHG